MHGPAYESSVKTFRRDTYDGVYDVIESLRFPDNLRIAFEAALPELVADDCDRMGAAPGVFARLESAAQNGMHPNSVKIVRGDDAARGDVRALTDT